MIRMPHDPDVAMTRSSLRTERIERMLCMAGVASQSCLDFLVHTNIDLDPSLGSPLENLVQSKVLLVICWPSQKQFWGQPPVANVNGFLGLLKRNRDGPKIVAAVYVPLDEIALALGKEGFESMRLTNCSAFLITALLMFFIMAMTFVELYFSPLVVRTKSIHEPRSRSFYFYFFKEKKTGHRVKFTYQITKLSDLMSCE